MIILFSLNYEYFQDQKLISDIFFLHVVWTWLRSEEAEGEFAQATEYQITCLLYHLWGGCQDKLSREHVSVGSATCPSNGDHCVWVIELDNVSEQEGWLKTPLGLQSYQSSTAVNFMLIC